MVIKISNKLKFWAGILLAQFILFQVLSYSKSAVKAAQTLFEWKKNYHQLLFSGFEISIGDLLYIILFIFLIWNIVLIFNKKKRGQALYKLLLMANFFVFIYQMSWGLLYFQEPVIHYFSKQNNKTSIENITEEFLQKCIVERQKVHEDEHGIFKIKDKNLLKKSVLLAQQNLPKDIFDKKPSKIISIKPSLFGEIMSYTGITGYYNPFTAEAQYDENFPDSDLPFTLAHEAAHQMGYAREEEASFMGWLSESLSKNPELKYSADYFALKSLLSAQAEKNPKFVKYIIAKYSPKILRDRKFEKDFIKQHEGIADEFFALTNDLFLKSNRQDGAVNYSYFVDLLIHYERSKK